MVIAGCGALGTVQAESLARAGVGRLTLIDRDFVEQSNLHRQFLFDEADAFAGTPKAIAAARRIASINSEIQVHPQVIDLEPRTIRDACEGAHLILDATDNFETRYLINDYAVSSGTPWIYGAAVGTYGISLTILPGNGPCFRCIYPDPPPGVQPTCETAGVLGTVTMFIATVQANEALKLLSGNGDALRPDIFTADFWTNRIRESPMPERDPNCPACGRREFEWLDGKHRAPVSLCGRNAVQIHADKPIDLSTLERSLNDLGKVRRNEFALRFTNAQFEITVFPDGRAIVKGTTDPGVARSAYSRFIGQ